MFSLKLLHCCLPCCIRDINNDNSLQRYRVDVNVDCILSCRITVMHFCLYVMMRTTPQKVATLNYSLEYFILILLTQAPHYYVISNLFRPAILMKTIAEYWAYIQFCTFVGWCTFYHEKLSSYIVGKYKCYRDLSVSGLQL